MKLFSFMRLTCVVLVLHLLTPDRKLGPGFPILTGQALKSTLRKLMSITVTPTNLQILNNVVSIKSFFLDKGTYWVTFLLIKMVYLPIAVTKKKIVTYLGLLRWV